MLTITVNGREMKLSIGCRTFVTLDVLLTMLKATVQKVILNGTAISRNEFGTTTVNNHDTLKLA